MQCTVGAALTPPPVQVPRLRHGDQGGEVSHAVGGHLELVAAVRLGDDGEQHGEEARGAGDGGLGGVAVPLDQVTHQREVEVGAEGETHAVVQGLEVPLQGVPGSAANRSIGSTTGCTITEKAPTRAFSWLKTATNAFTFKIKTLLIHYAKRALTPRSLNVITNLRMELFGALISTDCVDTAASTLAPVPAKL